MSSLPDKRAVREALRAAIEGTLRATVQAARDAADGATHAENRSEGDKDMRATEQSYVARGQAMRAEELAEELARFDAMPRRTYGPDDPIGPDALVRVAIEEQERVLYVVPWAGGTELEVAGVPVTAVTPASPLGRALIGRRAGDDFEVLARGAMRAGEVVEID